MVNRGSGYTCSNRGRFYDRIQEYPPLSSTGRCSRKLIEIEKNKKRIARYCEEAMEEIRETLDSLNYPELATADDLKLISHIFKKITGMALHTTRDVATICHQGDYVLCGIAEENIKSTSTEHSFVRGMKKVTLYNITHNTLALINSYATRNMDAPTSLKLASPRRPLLEKILFKDNSLKYVKGLERGPSRDPFNPLGAELFFNVIGASKEVGESYLNALYFNVMQTNKILYFLMLKKSVWFPLKIVLRDTRFPHKHTNEVHLVSVKTMQGFIDKTERSIQLIYENLETRHKFVAAYSREDKIKSFFKASGYQPKSLNQYEGREIFVVNLDFSDAQTHYVKNIVSICWDMHSQPVLKRLQLMIYAYATYISKKTKFHQLMGWD